MLIDWSSVVNGDLVEMIYGKDKNYSSTVIVDQIIIDPPRSSVRIPVIITGPRLTRPSWWKESSNALYFELLCNGQAAISCTSPLEANETFSLTRKDHDGSIHVKLSHFDSSMDVFCSSCSLTNSESMIFEEGEY